MSVPFNPQQDLIVVPAYLEGPTGRTTVLQLALDTAASGTLVSAAALMMAGYDPALAPAYVQLTTASGVTYIPQVQASKLSALGQHRTNFPVFARTVPSSVRIDGLLGLDFLRGHLLTIDFRNAQIILS
jgi:hypothetical protein